MKQISIKLPDEYYNNLEQIQKKIEEQFGNYITITKTDAIKYCIATTADLQNFAKDDFTE